MLRFTGADMADLALCFYSNENGEDKKKNIVSVVLIIFIAIKTTCTIA